MTRVDYFDREKIRENLKTRTVRGGAWTGASQVVSILLSLAAQPVLARLLDPADFGLVAMVAVFTNFAAMFVDAGLSAATVQRDEINHRQVTNLFWIANAAGVGIALVVGMLSPLIAWLYGEPRLVAITLALCVSYLLSGLTVQHQALMHRAMQFKQLVIAGLAAQLLGIAAGVTWAWRFRDTPIAYWALVLIPVTGAAVRLIATWLMCGWRPGLPRSDSGTRELITFGANLTGFNFVNYFSRNADNMLIGWWWGATPLGYYERAYKLFLFPLQTINSPLSNVMIPALSRLAHDRQRLIATYFRVLRPLLLALVPAIAMVSVTAEWWVEAVLGEGWSAASPILRCLTIAGITQPFSGSTGWLFVSQNKTRELFFVGSIVSASSVVAFCLGLPWGAVGVATAYAISGIFFRVPFLVYSMDRHNLLPASRVLRELTNMIPAAGAVVASNLALRWALPGALAWQGLLASLLVSAIAWSLVVFFTPHGRRVVKETLAIRQHLT